MKTTINWNETRGCRNCGPKQRMMLLHADNHNAEDRFRAMLLSSTVRLISETPVIVKIFGCPKCGLKIRHDSPKGYLPPAKELEEKDLVEAPFAIHVVQILCEETGAPEPIDKVSLQIATSKGKLWNMTRRKYLDAFLAELGLTSTPAKEAKGKT